MKILVAVVFLTASPLSLAAQNTSRYITPRTPWGDPDLQGVFTNEDEQHVPLERPARFAGRTLDSITANELADFAAESNAAETKRESAFGGISAQRLGSEA